MLTVAGDLCRHHPVFCVLDFFVSVFQAVCFPIYGIAKIRRADYFVFDRHHLAYLNALEKLNCAYCSYANGLIAYTREIAARTEQYWCPIKHARRVIGTHARYALFDDYGDAEGYQDAAGQAAQDAGQGRGEAPRVAGACPIVTN